MVERHDDWVDPVAGTLVLVSAVAFLVLLFVAVMLQKELSLSWRLIGVEPVSAEVIEVRKAGPMCIGSYELPGEGGVRRVDRRVSCDAKPVVGEIVLVRLDPDDSANFREVGSAWAKAPLVLLALAGAFGLFVAALRRRKREPRWVASTIEALVAEGIEAERLTGGGVAFPGGVLDKSGSAMSLTLRADGLPDCHLSRATVLPGESLEVGEEDFDATWRLKTLDPIALAVVLSGETRRLLERIEGCEVREGRLRIWGSQGHPSTFVKNGRALLSAMTRPPWGRLVLDGLERTGRGFRGRRGAFSVTIALIADGPEVSTRVVVDVHAPFRAARSGLAKPKPTGNVVLDQLVEVEGELELDEEAVELLLQVVHGWEGRVTRKAIAVERPGVLVEVEEVLEVLVQLAAAIRATGQTGGG